MPLDTTTLHEWFSHFNHLCFQDQLPLPQLVLSRSRTRLGSMTCRRSFKNIIFAKRTFTLRISTYYDSTSEELQDVLLHEMIHYFIMFNNVRDTSPHGKVFRQMMDEINRKYHRHITVSSRCNNKNTVSTEQHNSKRLVLALEIGHKKHFLSVVNPYYADKIKHGLQFVKDLTHCEWFVSEDSFFHDFPAVRSLRARKVNQATFEKELSKGEKTNI